MNFLVCNFFTFQFWAHAAIFVKLISTTVVNIALIHTTNCAAQSFIYTHIRVVSTKLHNSLLCYHSKEIANKAFIQFLLKDLVSNYADHFYSRNKIMCNHRCRSSVVECSLIIITDFFRRFSTATSLNQQNIIWNRPFLWLVDSLSLHALLSQG